jgi:hypothetical protein
MIIESNITVFNNNETNNISLQDFGVNHIAVGEDEKRKALKYKEIKKYFY